MVAGMAGRRIIMALRHRVGKAVAEVKLRRMPASLSIPRESSKGGLYFLCGDRYRSRPGHLQKFAHVVLRILDAGTTLAGQAEHGFEESDRRSQWLARAVEHVDKGIRTGLPGQNGDDGGSIDEHHSLPLRES